jgi:hypothetical protein
MKRYRQYTQVYCDCTIQEHAEGEWVKWQDLLQFKTELLEIIADKKVTTEMKLKYLELHIRMCAE